MNKYFKVPVYVLALILVCAVHTAGAVTVSVDDASRGYGTTVDIPINVSSTSNIGAMDISLTYDSAVITATGVVANGTLISATDLIASYTGTSDIVNISVASTSGITGTGSIAIVQFSVVGSGGATSPLTLSTVDAYDLDNPVIVDGSVTGYAELTVTSTSGTFTTTGDAQTVSIADGSAYSGDTTTVMITADDVTDLANFDITVTYNPAVVNVTDAVNDVAFGSAVNNLENAANGSVRLASLNLGAGQTGDGILLSTLTLEAVGTAGQTSALTLTINELKNSTGVDITATMDDGTFTVMVPVINLSISDGNASAGATTTVTITADNVTDVDLANFDITVTYNPAVVIVTGAANDAAFGSAVNNLENAANGSVQITSLNLGAGQTGDGILLSTLTLEAVGTAGQTSALTLTINELSDSTGGAITAIPDNGVFTAGLPQTGDIDGSGGDPTMNDAVYLAKHVVGLAGYETIHADGDIDGSGGDPTMNDAVYLAKHVVGLSGYETIYP